MTPHNPPHPGEFIHAVYLEPFGMSSRALAGHLNVAPATLHRILKQQRSINAEMALRLSMVIGRSPESWLAMQQAYDLWVAKQAIELSGVKRLKLIAL
ncbi:MAG: HigA family addiction module antitoxin [Pseudomonadota bacterium]